MGALTLLDTTYAGYLKGLWEGYQTALSNARCQAALDLPPRGEWDGDRAERFRSWWEKTTTDLDAVSAGIAIVIGALEIFIARAVAVNEQLSIVESNIRNNCYDVSVGTDNSITGTFKAIGAEHYLTVTGNTMSGLMLDMSLWPPWLLAVSQAAFEAGMKYMEATHAADSVLEPAIARFKSVHQLSHLKRSSVGTSDLADPTWTQLTGGGVFRPTPAGFTHDPFSAALMPDWYDPTTAHVVSHWIGSHEWIVDLAAIFLAMAGAPEVGFALELVMHGTKLAIDVSDGDTGEIPWDSVDLVLDFAGAGALAKRITDSVMYRARHAVEPSRLPKINETVTNFVQARMREALAEAVKNPDGKYIVSAAVISEIYAEAQGKADALTAAETK